MYFVNFIGDNEFCFFNKDFSVTEVQSPMIHVSYFPPLDFPDYYNHEEKVRGNKFSVGGPKCRCLQPEKLFVTTRGGGRMIINQLYLADTCDRSS